jgi:hypothetical protein
MANASSSSNHKDTNEKNPVHITLIEMLFALAIAEIATESGVLIQYLRDNWNAVDWQLASTVISHLMLALFVIVLSWIGWNASDSVAGETELLTSDFVELIIDAFLVIVYFILVRTSELPEKDVNGVWLLNAQSAKPETICITTVFWLYLIWDCVSKFKVFRVKWMRFIPTLICTAICLIIVLCIDINTSNPINVVIIDMTLLFVMLLFRALKYKTFPKLPLSYALFSLLCFASILILLYYVIFNP